MYMKKIFSVIFFICFFIQLINAQIRIDGKVVDEEGLAVIGATIKVKGKTQGTVTDINGTFSISANKGDVLAFSYIGMQSVEKKIETNTMNVVMIPDIINIEELVVIGYGVARKSDLTGSVSSLKSDDLMRSSPLSLQQGVLGKVAGVIAQQIDGAPGSGMSFQIRGANSFSGGTEPLYVIDDIPFDTGGAPGSIGGDLSATNPLSMINPSDIESIEILKDASATAIYGSRGANGVVLIRTKQGIRGKAKIEVNINQGWSTPTNAIDVLPANIYAKLYNEARINADLYDVDAGYIAGNNMKFFDVFGTKSDMRDPQYYETNSSDWQKMIFQTGMLTDATLSMSGGADKVTYRISANHTNQNGIIKSSLFKRTGIRVNLQGQLTTNLSFGINSNFTGSENRFVKTGSDVGQAGGVIRSALRYPPIYSVRTSDGELADEWYDASNPLTYILSQKNQVDDIKNITSGYIESNILTGLTFRVRIGSEWGMSKRSQYLPAQTRESRGGKAAYRDNINSKLVNENILTYNRNINKIHNFNVVTAATWEISNRTYRLNEVSGFINDYLQDNAMQTANEIPVINNGRSKSTLASFLGRVNYSLKNRYLFTISGRADGSSRFAKNNKWAYFPSAAFAWRANEEDYIKSLDIFSNLKFRFSYGKTGNQAISTYGSLTRMNALKYPFEDQLYTGVAISSDGLGNDNLTWETTKQYNTGIDVGFFDNRLNLIVDVYRKNTYDLLQQQELPLSLGYNRRWVNMGELQNEGLEITLNAYPINRRGFSWQTDFNLSFNRNKILSLGPGIPSQTINRIATDVEPFMLVAGQALGDIYAYKIEGIYQSLEEVKAHGLYNNDEALQKFMVGEYKYFNASNPLNDPDKDFILNTSDRVVVGNSNPDYVFGLTNTFVYKNLDFSFFVQGVVGNDIVNTTAWSMENNIGGSSSNIRVKTYNNLWRGEGTSNTLPKVVESKKRLVLFSDKYVEDGTYIRLKNINLGYNFKMAPKSVISTVRASFIATNIFTITNYSGFDPEVNAFNTDPARRGVDMGNYPASRTYSFNLSATF